MNSLRRRSSLIFRAKPSYEQLKSGNVGPTFVAKRKEEEKLDCFFVNRRNSHRDSTTSQNIREKVYNDIFDGKTRPYSTFTTHQPNNSFDDSSYTNHSTSVKSYKYDSVKRKRQHLIHWLSSLF